MKMPNANGQPAPLVNCECSTCKCDLAAPKEADDVAALCYFCEQGQHRTVRVIRLEQELERAKEQISQLEDMKGIQWKH